MSELTKQLDEFLRKRPVLGRDVYIAQSAVVVGDVTLEDNASVWYNATVRGDINRIVIGKGSNVQDNAVLHLADEYPCIVGEYVTIGHSAIVHACTVGNEVLIGMGAIILDGAEVGDQCLIGANALIPPGTQIPAGSLVLGSPGRVTRKLSDQERKELKYWADKYVKNSAYCLQNKINVGAPLQS